MKSRTLIKVVIVICVLPWFGEAQTLRPSEAIVSQSAAGCSISVTSQPPDARVFLDSVYVGRTPLHLDSLREKRYSLILLSPKYEQWRAIVMTGRTETVTVNAVLALRKTLLAIETAPENAAICLDGATLSGEHAKWTEISEGEHEIEVRSDSLARSISRSFVVSPGGELSLKARLGFASLTAMSMSALLPGSGQIRDGAIVTGVGYLAGTAALVGVCFRQNKDYHAMLYTYRSARNDYMNARSDAEIVRTRDVMIGAKRSADKAYRYRNAALAAFAGFYLLNVADAYLFHRLDDDIRVISKDDATLAVTEPVLPGLAVFSCGLSIIF